MTQATDTGDIQIRILQTDDADLLYGVPPGVFDWPIEQPWCDQFLADPRHHLAIAISGAAIVGFASGVHYVHPDKAPELYINEVGVTPSFRRRGIGKALMQCLLQHAIALGCTTAWLLTEKKNTEARSLYRDMGGQESADEPVYYSFRLGNLPVGRGHSQ
jgi:ribosomal protein S18 acetylase RimI-like enzyme